MTLRNLEEVLLTVLNSHASLDKKSLRSNNSSFMINTLQKANMIKSLLRNIYFKNRKKSIDKVKKYEERKEK